ncbi:hypothetical protein Ahy_A07g033264 isoform A [Arachis hypogaea]|uniref:Protein cereblon n=1 Tax=Arachis hypogaea TaxID=3818 RepID=A0A445C8T1_ARAHY|nr:hypothetical protein Ahy_A07g033264 isoform A [Arachis hypogaea]
MDLVDQDLLLEEDEVEQDYTYFLRQYLEEHLEDDDGDGVVHLAEPSLHTYLGEIEDTRHRTAFLDGDSVVNLPLFRLQGVVLFPGATLPLRVIEPRMVAAVERALSQVDVPYTIGVIRIHRDTANWRMKSASIGTTAEIRQYGRLQDGSLNVVTRGQQRFRLRRCWNDADGVPYGEIEIIEEGLPLKTPRDVFGELGPSSARSSGDKVTGKSYQEIRSNLNEAETKDSRIDSCSTSGNQSCIGEELNDSFENRYAYPSNKISTAFWPHWVYRMFDSHSLAQRAAGILLYMWRKIIGVPSMDNLVKKPDILSFYIASKIPVSESTRQELLDIDGIAYRLRKEIELLESIDIIQCKSCQTIIAKRSDMLVMSSEGPLGAYVNPGGYVHEIMTLHKANGLDLDGPPATEYSWFPGYAWTITRCASCRTQMGWLFTATTKKLKPRSFWGIRSCQVA